jgi:hypothetical protein
MNGKFKIRASMWINECDYILERLQKSPLAVAVDATNWADYSSGVIN